TGLQYPAQLGHRLAWIWNMLDGFAGDDRVKTAVRMADGLYVSHLPGDGKESMGLSILLAHLHRGRRKICGDDVSRRMGLSGQPAGESSASAADLDRK